MEVPDLADTERLVAEGNCIGAIPPGGEQPEANHQSGTMAVVKSSRSELDSVGGVGEPASEWRSPNKIVRSALREWNASGRAPLMVGAGMVGSSDDVNQGTTVGGDEKGLPGSERP